MTNLATLIEKGDFNAIKSIKDIRELAKKPMFGNFSSNFTDFQNPFPIQFAAALNNENIVEYFLRLGVDPNYIESSGYSALHLAILNKNVLMTCLLLDNGADINIPDPFGCHCIFTAIRYSNSEVLTEILKRNPCLDKEYKGDYPLHFALQEKKVDMAFILISYGHSIEKTNAKEFDAKSLAEKQKLNEFLKVVNDETELNKLIHKQKHIFMLRKVQMIPENEENIQNEDQIVKIKRDEYILLKERLLNLEMIVSRLLPNVSNEKLLNPQICFACKSKKGLNICPVCGNSFCQDDFYNHVLEGCKL
ncbi:AKT1-like potassium channel, putative [Trichomonas vaginalis G3]|uniref:AKT1-like potassium channel, putative n=1 Tax=Trichomonas vaginalis (strain ATCC PRA-98 / G3) TaxID=412133 RepID=A2FGI2_TRIV3|nr:spectrin binding [Trichomonas vaginalis G3]EAX95996.1 AKT1-like potassium channel, putative [Trichomonas vaginalis G3]KAI5537673.1 spectrin binding [Trichomonas vaginalis G3]|eukprot:XP_001308926.1 AKT1-like potassium channel [Trichomonas vaginalis G3]